MKTMKTWMGALACALVLTGSRQGWGADTQSAVLPSPASPSVVQVVGEDEADLGPTRYPEFYEYDSDNPACGEYLKADGKDETGAPGDEAENGLSLAPLWLKSTYAGEGVLPVLDGVVGFTATPGLTKTLEIPDRFRTNSELMVSWTIRVEAYTRPAYTVRGNLCSAWNGTSYQQFPKGEVHSKLYVNGKPRGQLCTLSIPGAGAVVSEEPVPQPRDPTLSCSHVLTGEDFGPERQLPETVELEVRWYNATSMLIKSLPNTRSLILTVFPVTEVRD